jgi:hypothetical protein
MTKQPRARDRVLDGYAKQIRRFAKRTVDDIVKIAELLEKAKKRLPHGEFLPWTAREFEWSADTTQRIMRVGKLLAKNRTLRHLNPSVLYELARPTTPEAARISITERAEAGGVIRVGDVRREIQRARPFLTPSASPQPANKLPKITTEVLQTARRRHLIDLIVDVARQLPPDLSNEEARAVIASTIANGKRDSFSAAVATLGEFIDQLRRVLSERLIDVSASPTNRR